MTIISILLGSIVIYFGIGRIIDIASRRKANSAICRIHALDEHPLVEEPYIRLAPLTRRKRGKKYRKRIAMIAPYGSCKRMVSRQRIIPVAITLMERGYMVSVFVPAWDCPENSFHEEKHIGSLKIVKIGRKRSFWSEFDPILFFRLLRKILLYKPEVIYSFKPIRYSGSLSLLLYLLRKTPLVGAKLKIKKILVDTDEWEGYGGWSNRIGHSPLIQFLRNEQEKYALRLCDKVIVASKTLENRAKRIRKGRNGVLYFPTGIKPELWKNGRHRWKAPELLSQRLGQVDDPKPLLLFTRFIEVEAERIMYIFSQVIKQVPSAYLMICGTSLDKVGRLQRLKLPPLAEEFGIDKKRIVQVGWIPFFELRDYWSVTNVAICPYENTNINRSRSPTKILELMAASKAVIAFEMGEISNIIEDGKNGLMVPAENNDAFVETVVRLLNDKDLQTILGKNARRTATNDFDWDHLIEDLEDVIEGNDENEISQNKRELSRGDNTIILTHNDEW